MFKKRLLRTALLSIIALVIGGGIAFVQIKNERAIVVRKASSIAPMAGVQIGGVFELVDHNGAAVTQENYAGSYKLIYFGFTYCPAICPTELQKISKVMKVLDEEGEGIQPLFITVDPERDTVDVMREYVAMFHPRLVGLSGSRAQIDAALKNYRVFASKVQNEEDNDYTMDHSSYIYLMSPDDELLAMYRIQDGVDYVVNDIRGRLGDV